MHDEGIKKSEDKSSIQTQTCGQTDDESNGNLSAADG